MKNNEIISIIIARIEKILSYCDDIDIDAFTANEEKTEACVFNLLQIGELANKLDSSFTLQYPDIPWRQIYGLRNRLVHDYEGVNINLVWEIISEDLPELLCQLKNIKYNKDTEQN